MSDLAGKRAIVTGASSGIGEGIAVALARAGASVACCGRDETRTQATREAAAAHDVDAIALTGDVAEPDDVARMVGAAVDRFGGLDVLVNCAGIGELDGWVRVHEHSLDAWRRTLAVNLSGPFLMAKAVIPAMLEAGGGAMVHISSVCATTVWAGDSAYGVSKAALNQLSDHIAVEYGPDGIRSNVLMPGEIVTPLHYHAANAAPDPKAWEEEVLAKHPIGRFGEVEEVAAAAVFLCSGASGFLTGASIPIDGGYSRV